MPETDYLKPFIAKLADGFDLTTEETEEAFGIMMAGQATQSQMGAFLMGLRAKGETVQEVVLAAEGEDQESKIERCLAFLDTLSVVDEQGKVRVCK